ncbi:MAG: hypothetical protein COB69_09560 [Phycisphaera sp.]|nr:MAG: hypothetical protein COB69_10235 [Phycisphaera sp.]PHQ78641.1 MAG: hypothetical protein COB69_09560 [Phycisphaera sp.]
MDNDRRAARDRMMPAARRLELLRTRRTWPERDTSLSPTLIKVRNHLQKQLDQIDPMLEVWNRVIPEELASRTKIRLDKGTLIVSARDSSIRFALDRLLRAGAQNELIRQAPVPIRTVKLESKAQPRPRPRDGGPASTTRNTNSR